MANRKKIPKYNVLSIRVTDKEKAQFDELKRNTRKNISMLMREALQHYFPYVEMTTSQRQ
jgi:predicted transcriptional regulator